MAIPRTTQRFEFLRAMALLAAGLAAGAPPTASQACGPEDMFLAPTVAPIVHQSSLSLADLDGDGDLDSVSTRPTQALTLVDGSLVILEPQVTALLNNGAADPTELSFDSAQQPEGVRAADFDGDGIPDLAVASGAENGVAIHTGVGDGTFGAHVLLPCATPSAHVAVADVDANGTPDVIAGGLGASGQVFVLRGVGDGTFLPADAYAVGDGPLPITVDVDGDGDLDIVSTNVDTDDYSVLVNQGDGTFLALPDTPIGDEPLGVAAEDLDGDGVADLVVALKADREVQVLLGAGDGSFSLAASYATTALFGDYSEPYRLAVWDANGDAHPDLAIACGIPFAGTVSVMLGSASGAFTAEQTYLMGNALGGLEIGDVDGDGAEDIVVASEAGSGFSVYFSGGITTARSNGDGSLDTQPAVPVIDPNSVSTADLDGDGVLDFVATSIGSNGAAGVSVALGLGAGAFAPAQFYEIGDELVIGVETADLDGDGNTDVAVCVTTQNRVFVYLGQGDGTLAPPTTVLAGPQPEELRAADFDEDGVLDLAITRGHEFVLVLIGAGDGTFTLGGSVLVGNHVLEVADFDGDGHADLAAGGSTGLHVALGKGDGSFWPQQLVAADEPFYVALTAADFNADGLDDLASSTQQGVPGGLGQVHLAAGLGTFHPPVEFSTEGLLSSFGLNAGDLDGDGIVDLVLTGGGVGPSVLSGQGDGSFGTPQLHPAGGLSRAPAIADLDGDGMQDMLLPCVNKDVVLVLRNQCALPSTPWANLGEALAGGSGLPELVGAGSLLGGAPASLALTSGEPSTAAWLLMGLARLDLPFKGGTLVPDFRPPFGLYVPLATDAQGSLSLAALWPVGLPPGTEVFLQYWLVDPAGPVGFSASNALQATTP